MEKRLKLLLFFVAIIGLHSIQAQDTGGIPDVVIQIVNPLKVELPKADRNYEKIPPRPAEPIQPAINYQFTPVLFFAPPFNPVIRPLRLKDSGTNQGYQNFVSAGFGNYGSPYLNAVVTSKGNNGSVYGARLFHHSFAKGPVDNSNSSSGTTEIGIFGKASGSVLSLQGSAGYESKRANFYGYVPGSAVEKDTLKQKYSVLTLSGILSNSTKADANFSLKADYSYLTDHYDAAESELALEFESDYKINPKSIVKLSGSYALISRKDEAVEAKPRHLLTVLPSFAFYPVENFLLAIGLKGVVENDTIGKNKSIHLYPDVLATYKFSKGVNFYASLSGGTDKVSLRSLSSENIWIAPNIPIYHTNRVFDFAGGVEALLGKKWGFKAGLSFSDLKNYYFFVNSASDQAKFEPVYDNARRTNFFGQISYSLPERSSLMLRGDYYNFDTDTLGEALHRPSYRLSLSGSTRIVSKLSLWSSFILQGGVKAFVPESSPSLSLDPALDPAINLAVKTEYHFSEKVSVFIRLDNALARDYMLFLNYPVRGFQAQAGLTWLF